MLNDKQNRFCEEYMIDLNATQAAIRAGYSEKTARSIANELLTKPDIQERISHLQKDSSERLQISRDRVIAEYAKMAFLDPRRFFDDKSNLKFITDLDADVAAALAGIDIMEEFQGKGEDKELVGFTKKIKFSDKRASLDSLCKVLGYNAPTKVAETDSAGNDRQTLDESKLKEALEIINGAPDQSK